MILEKLLCPPGDGIFTVHTAQEYKQNLQKNLYGNADSSFVKSKWQKSLLEPKSDLAILGIPSDCGGGILRGANWGPLFIRESIYKSYDKLNILDLGDVRTVPHLLHDKYLNADTINACRESLYGSKEEVLPVSPLSIAQTALDHIYKIYPNVRILGLGGDHSVSYPLTLSFLNSRKDENVGILHFDAHTDLLNSRLGIDICFGSWTSHIIPHLKSPKNLVQVGIRSTGKPKEHWENTFGIKQIWAHEVKDNSASTIAKQIASHFKNASVSELYITFDIDCLDASIASATGTPEVGGIEVEQAQTIIDLCAQEIKVTGADVVEVAPFTCSNANKVNEPTTTLNSATTICKSLMNAMR